MNKIKVLQAGALTTIQDLGRVGYQKFGIPVTGVMDEYSFRLANILVGNDEGEAALEMTLMGPKLQFGADTVFAITGADLSPTLDGKKVPMFTSVLAKKDSVLSFGMCKKGMRAYLAFAGAIDVPAPNGSKSTFMKSKIGGFEGRKLEKDDELFVDGRTAESGLTVSREFYTDIKKELSLRVVLGPQEDYFTDQGIQTFSSKEGYTITEQSDRMGVRLDGAKIEHKETADIISDAAVIGSIQVPASGTPIILMADRQTTGGYTKIATVIKEDIAKLAQIAPQSKVFFDIVSIEEAQELYRSFYDKLAKAKASLGKVEPVDSAATVQAAMMYAVGEYIAKGESGMKKFKIRIDGEEHEIEIESMAGGATGSSASAVNAVKEQVVAPMAGNIIQLAVKEGDEVKAGQLLLLFEALKMENEISANTDGKIGKIYVSVNDKIESGAVLVDII